MGAVAALLRGELGHAWMAPLRRWTLIPWAFLTVGIVLGAWWAYAVLGWGGYWGWDPVENAGLLPWFTATAFLHSVIVQERRGALVGGACRVLTNTAPPRTHEQGDGHIGEPATELPLVHEVPALPLMVPLRGDANTSARPSGVQIGFTSMLASGLDCVVSHCSPPRRARSSLIS